MDVVDWLQEIRDAILYEPINLWLGFSFLCRNSRSGDIIYLFACPQLSPFHSKFRNPTEFNAFIDEFKGKSHLDLLEDTKMPMMPLKCEQLISHRHITG